MDESFVDPDNSFLADNTVLREDQNVFPRNLVYTVPLITMNSQIVRESMKRDVIFSAICEKLLNPPEICLNPDEIRLIARGDEKGGLNWFLILLFIGILITLLIIFWVRRMMRKYID